MREGRVRTFRGDPMGMAGPAVLTFVLVLGLTLWKGFPSIAAAAYALLSAFIVAAILLFLMLLYTTQVHAWGIRSYDAFGVMHRATWGQMTRASIQWIWPIPPYIRIARSKGVPILLWTRTQDFDELCQLILEAAPPDHPLCQFLRKRFPGRGQGDGGDSLAVPSRIGPSPTSRSGAAVLEPPVDEE